MRENYQEKELEEATFSPKVIDPKDRKYFGFGEKT